MTMGLVSLIAAYLIGGIPFGLLIVRLTTDADVRKHGSGNIGATNVLRTAGRGAGIITLVLDGLKGAFAVWLAGRLTGELASGADLWMSFAALAVLCGHAFSIFLGFKGGKAVASFVGAFAYLTPLPLLAVVLIFVFLTATTRYLSLGSIAAAGLFPLACWMILHPDWPVLVASVGAAVLIIERHRGNIERIRAGEERVFTFGGKK
jgi:glycerol-3-phosphate acyltransferase PlsY